MEIGREKGVDIGADKKTVEIIAYIMRTHHLTYDEAADYLGVGSEKEKYRSAVEEAMRETVQS